MLFFDGMWDELCRLLEEVVDGDARWDACKPVMEKQRYNDNVSMDRFRNKDYYCNQFLKLYNKYLKMMDEKFSKEPICITPNFYDHHIMVTTTTLIKPIKHQTYLTQN